MKQKIKKAFESTVWWSGVIMVGLVLGLTIQFVKAWTEPTEAPPNGNVGAPINTGVNLQTKNGSLALLGQLITSFINVPGDIPAPGDVLTAQNASGQVAWAAGGGGGGIYTRWGYDTCVGTDTLIYDGEGVYPWMGAGAGSMVCIDGELRDLPHAKNLTNVDHTLSNNSEVIGGTGDGIKIQCAVCVR
jgi:hypothetical protein